MILPCHYFGLFPPFRFAFPHFPQNALSKPATCAIRTPLRKSNEPLTTRLALFVSIMLPSGGGRRRVTLHPQSFAPDVPVGPEDNISHHRLRLWPPGLRDCGSIYTFGLHQRVDKVLEVPSAQRVHVIAQPRGIWTSRVELAAGVIPVTFDSIALAAKCP